MEPLKPRFVIAGCGPGSRLYVPPAVEQAVAKARVLAGATRLLELFGESAAVRLPFRSSIDAWLDELAAQPEGPLVVLVSGDPGVSSLAAHVRHRFGRSECQVIPAVSSVQLACALLGLSWDNAAIVDVHGSVPEELPLDLCARDPWVILMGAPGGETLVANLAEATSRLCFVCEDLSLDTQSIVMTHSEALAELPSHPRRIVVLTHECCHE